MVLISVFRNYLSSIKKYIYFPVTWLGFGLKGKIWHSESPVPESWINFKDFGQKTKGGQGKINETEVLNFANYVLPSLSENTFLKNT